MLQSQLSNGFICRQSVKIFKRKSNCGQSVKTLSRRVDLLDTYKPSVGGVGLLQIFYSYSRFTHQFNIEGNVVNGRDSFVCCELQRLPDLLFKHLYLNLRQKHGNQVDHVKDRLPFVQQFACRRNYDRVEFGCGAVQGSRWSSVVSCMKYLKNKK